jgi:ubiquinone/menaquinone biosynthesis C-methylase UbiE
MVRKARRRNAAAVRAGHVDLRQAAVDMLPFDDGAFDKVVSINTMQVWPDIPAGLREVRRVAKSQGRIALAFTPYSGQSADGLVETVAAAGFADARLVENDENICVVAVKA